MQEVVSWLPISYYETLTGNEEEETSESKQQSGCWWWDVTMLIETVFNTLHSILCFFTAFKFFSPKCSFTVGPPPFFPWGETMTSHLLMQSMMNFQMLWWIISWIIIRWVQMIYKWQYKCQVEYWRACKSSIFFWGGLMDGWSLFSLGICLLLDR